MTDQRKHAGGCPAKESSEAETWLRGYLANGDQPALARANFNRFVVGFSWMTLRRAKLRLKIVTYQRGDGYFWTLEPRVDIEAELSEMRQRQIEAQMAEREKKRKQSKK